jgi:flavin-dependent dehydrogenase
LTNVIEHAFAIIVGGGPAGCAAAIRLARSGRNVVILEQSRYERQRIGELLPPGAKQHLHRLGAYATIRSYILSPGIVSIWGSTAPTANDFIFNPYGDGWHLDRRQFDQSLVDLARDCGAAVHNGIRRFTFVENTDGTWNVEAQAESSAFQFRATFLVDATGRKRRISRRLGARPLGYDRQVAVIADVVLPTDSQIDRRLWLEAETNGWWYSAALPNHRMVVVYITDGDLLPHGIKSLNDIRLWLDRVPYTKLRLPSGCALIGHRMVSAQSYLMDRVAGNNWIAIGDAAMAWDPLSGQGITKALESGVHAADAVLEAEGRDRSALASYADWITTQFERYRSECANLYRVETRWSSSPFWQRRHAIRQLTGTERSH